MTRSSAESIALGVVLVLFVAGAIYLVTGDVVLGVTLWASAWAAMVFAVVVVLGRDL